MLSMGRLISLVESVRRARDGMRETGELEAILFAYALTLDKLPPLIRGSVEASLHHASEYAKLMLRVEVVSARIEGQPPAVGKIDVYVRYSEGDEWKGCWTYVAETDKWTWSGPAGGSAPPLY